LKQLKDQLNDKSHKIRPYCHKKVDAISSLKHAVIFSGVYVRVLEFCKQENDRNSIQNLYFCRILNNITSFELKAIEPFNSAHVLRRLMQLFNDSTTDEGMRKDICTCLVNICKQDKSEKTISSLIHAHLPLALSRAYSAVKDEESKVTYVQGLTAIFDKLAAETEANDELLWSCNLDVILKSMQSVGALKGLPKMRSSDITQRLTELIASFQSRIKVMHICGICREETPTANCSIMCQEEHTDSNYVCHECATSFISHSISSITPGSIIPIYCPFLHVNTKSKVLMPYELWPQHVDSNLVAQYDNLCEAVLSFQCGGCHSFKPLNIQMKLTTPDALAKAKAALQVSAYSLLLPPLLLLITSQ